MTEVYRCPFCGFPMPRCTHLGVFYIRHPNGRYERRQLDINGVEIEE